MLKKVLFHGWIRVTLVNVPDARTFSRSRSQKRGVETANAVAYAFVWLEVRPPRFGSQYVNVESPVALFSMLYTKPGHGTAPSEHC